MILSFFGLVSRGTFSKDANIEACPSSQEYKFDERERLIGRNSGVFGF
jgi:hypothetical protein